VYYCIWCSALVVLAVVVWSWVVSCVHCSTQPQPAQPVQNTIYSNTRSCSTDDGHNDARNMLRYKFDNKYRISCILLVYLSSPYKEIGVWQAIAPFYFHSHLTQL